MAGPYPSKPVDVWNLLICNSALEGENPYPEMTLAPLPEQGSVSATTFIPAHEPPPKIEFKTGPAGHHNHEHPADDIVQAQLPLELLNYVPKETIVAGYRLSEQDLPEDGSSTGKKSKCNCVCTTRKNQKRNPFMQALERMFNLHYQLGVPGSFLIAKADPKRSSFGPMAAKKVDGHLEFDSSLKTRQAVSHIICMINAGSTVMTGVSYFNRKRPKTDTNHWLTIYGYRLVESQDKKALNLQILAFDCGRQNSDLEKTKSRVTLLMDEYGRILHPGGHNKRPYGDGGYEVVRLGMVEVGNKKPMKALVRK